MRVLVTGAFGFIGTAVVRRLSLAGYEVVALTHRPPGTPRPASPASEVVHADICDAPAVRAAVAGVDAVCHLAALSRVRESFDRPAEYQQVNAVGTKIIVDAAGAKGEEGRQPLPFVQASTYAVYGMPQHQPISEDTPLEPVSPYGRTKAEAEDTIAAAAKTGALSAVCLRLFNVAGASGDMTDTDQTRIIPRTLAVAAGRVAHLGINGDGGAVRDFVHVEDVAAAFLLALAACGRGGYAVYNVGATAASMRDVVVVAEQVTGRVIPVVHNPPKPEPKVVVADSTRISRELSWAPERSSLTRIIGDAWEIFQDGGS